MNIAHFTLTFLPGVGGAQYAVHNLAIHQQREHQVTVVTSWKSYRASHRSVPYRVLPLLPGSQRCAWRCARSRIARAAIGVQLRIIQWLCKFDAWHVHFAYPTGYTAWCGLGGGERPRLVLTCHGADIQEREPTPSDPFASIRVRQVVQDTVRVFPSLVAVSESVRKRYLELGVREERISLLANGIDYDRHVPLTPSVREQVRRRYGVNGDTKLILTIGRHSPVKGYASIPEITEQLSRKGLSFIWLVVAGGMSENDKNLWARKLQEKVRVLDEIKPSETDGIQDTLPTEEMLQLYGAADVLISVSRMESFSCVILEAMASGLPVVATDVPGHRDLVDDGVTGFLTPLDQPDALAGHIDEIIRDSDKARHMSRAARNAARAYDWHGLAQRTNRLYDGTGT